MLLLVGCFWNINAIASLQTYNGRYILQFNLPNLPSSQTISLSHTHTHTFHTQRLAYSMLLVMYRMSRDFSDARGRNEGTEWRQPRCVCVECERVSARAHVLLFYFPLTLFVCVLSTLSQWLGNYSYLWVGISGISVSCSVRIYDKEVCSGLHMASVPLFLGVTCIARPVCGPSIRCQSGSSPHLFISMTEEPSCQSS